MLKKRIIPILLINEDQMVKSTKYKNYSYVGDPINIIKIFNEKEADEIIVLDVKRSISNQDPNYELIRKLATECYMPLTYGGGIKNIKQAEVWNDQELSTYDMGKFSKELRRIGNGYDSFQEDIDLWDDSRPSTALPSITVTHRQQLSKTKQRRRIIQIQKPEEDGEECNDEELTCIEMRITGKTAAAIRPYTALDDSKYQMSENIRATRAESQRISALRQKRLAESTAE